MNTYGRQNSNEETEQWDGEDGHESIGIAEEELDEERNGNWMQHCVVFAPVLVVQSGDGHVSYDGGRQRGHE